MSGTAETYGKRGVRLLQLRRDPRGLHAVREARARLLLSLASSEDYERGDNAAVVPTDTLKNTVHALALANGIRCLEEFASQLCEHVLRTHGRVERVRASLTETPWRRMHLVEPPPILLLLLLNPSHEWREQLCEGGAVSVLAGAAAAQDGKPHNHAFVLSPEVEFYCDVEAQQHGPPLVRSGLRGLRVLKTTQSGFAGFAREGFTSLEETRDRFFCTEMEARWAFQRGLSLSARDYDEARERVHACLLETFAGPPDTGVYSPSVQHTLYLAGQCVLRSLPHVEDIRITMSNLHYTPIDLRKLGLKNNDQASLTTRVREGSNAKRPMSCQYYFMRRSKHWSMYFMIKSLQRFCCINLRSSSPSYLLQVFLPTSSPAGLISATVCRQSTAKL
uniref:Uricase n=1 Tax=Petromyzon marinus TaxID=7757 RepID=A0AAJ7TXR3_PETMA|nr:uricase-like [Petromyzon marinus]